MTVPRPVWITVRVIAIEPEYNYLPHSTYVYINQLYQVEHEIWSNGNLNISCLKNMNDTY